MEQNNLETLNALRITYLLAQAGGEGCQRLFEAILGMPSEMTDRLIIRLRKTKNNIAEK